MAKCKNCKNLDHILNSGVSVGRWCVEKSDSPDIERERSCDKYVPKTNADRIRSMTDEELAEYLLEIARTKGENMYVCDTSGSNDMCLREETCEECMLAWLKSEVRCE